MCWTKPEIVGLVTSWIHVALTVYPAFVKIDEYSYGGDIRDFGHPMIFIEQVEQLARQKSGRSGLSVVGFEIKAGTGVVRDNSTETHYYKNSEYPHAGKDGLNQERDYKDFDDSASSINCPESLEKDCGPALVDVADVSPVAVCEVTENSDGDAENDRAQQVGDDDDKAAEDEPDDIEQNVHTGLF